MTTTATIIIIKDLRFITCSRRPWACQEFSRSPSLFISPTVQHKILLDARDHRQVFPLSFSHSFTPPPLRSVTTASHRKGKSWLRYIILHSASSSWGRRSEVTVGPHCMQTTKAYRKESSVRGKGSAPGCVPKLLLGNADSAVNGGNQGPSAPVMGRELHSQSVPLFVFRNRLTDWASPELSSRAESCVCACGLGPSPVPLGSLAQSQRRGTSP